MDGYVVYMQGEIMWVGIAALLETECCIEPGMTFESVADAIVDCPGAIPDMAVLQEASGV